MKYWISLFALFSLVACRETSTSEHLGTEIFEVSEASDFLENHDDLQNSSDIEEDEDLVQLCQAEGCHCLDEHHIQCCEQGVLRTESCADQEICFEDQCAAQVCEPYEVQSCTEDHRYYGCNPRGTGWGTYDCPSGFSCDGQDCIRQRCVPGEIRCIPPENPGVYADRFKVCDKAGLEFVDEGSKCSDADVKQVCDDNQCKPLCQALVKNSSYIGCEYWAVDLDNILEDPGNGSTAAGQPFAVVVSNATDHLTAHVDIYDAQGWSVEMPLSSFDLAPLALKTVVLPPGCYDQPEAICAEAYAVNNTSLTPSAFKIVSDVPITAYQFNPLDNTTLVYSNDASLLFPETSLGIRYLVMSGGTKWMGHPSYMTIVAVGEEPVEVAIRPRINTLPGRSSNGMDIPAIAAGETWNITLQPFDVLSIASAGESLIQDGVGNSDGDLTGSEILANGKIAVFAGSECTEVPITDPRTGACDHLEQQLYPVNNWGMHYHAIKSWPRRDSRDLWRIMARYDQTVVSTNPDVLGGAQTLNAGQWIDVLTTESFEVDANRPILLGQYLTGEQDPIHSNLGQPAGIGDPAFILGVPVEQYRKDYIFLAPDAYAEDYISIAAPLQSSIFLDQVELTPEVLEERSALVQELGTSGYRSIRLLIEDGVHHLTADQPVGLYVYGFDQYVSYGYPAGLDLGDLDH